MKKLFVIILLSMVCGVSHAVLKERDLNRTLGVLRAELTEEHRERVEEVELRNEETRTIVTHLRDVLRRCDQNSLMLYSQEQNYVFDLTYACHEATELYQEFRRQQLPFKAYLQSAADDIAKCDSLITTLEGIDPSTLSAEARTDRAVCLTLASSIRNTLLENREHVNGYITFYDTAEQRLKNLYDYANKRYSDIQTSIFMNGGDNYLAIMENFSSNWESARTILAEKYAPSKRQSDWDSTVILRLFAMILFYIVVAVLFNQIVFHFMPRRFHTKEFLKKRACIIMTSTTITFAAILALLQATLDQNFYMMASSLLIEYAWLLSVILISLLLRVDGDQIRSAFRIYTPLLVVGFLVISIRIVLIPRELVNMVFPPILLLCALWQWNVIGRHNKNVPRSDMFYTYLSQAIFILSIVCSWSGYTLMAVQILIWWIMQLTCILTITCLIQYLKLYGRRRGFESKSITQAWLYLLVYKVVLPVMGVLSLMVSIYWAAGVFNMGDLCWQIFKKDYIDMENLKVSIMKLSMVINAWFFFAYVSNTILALMRLHFNNADPTTAASREVMGRNVIQVLVWGVWLLFSLSLLHISVAWLLAISGGLSTGIGFASKDIIENIYYGATLMAGRIKVGDWIEVDGTMGKVNSISYTSTVIQSLYGEVITFQNSQLFAKNYKNLTRTGGYILAAIPFGVAYGSNLKQVTTVIEKAVNSLRHKWVDPSRAAKTVMIGMNDSSVDFKIFVWADAVKKVYVVSDVMKCIYDTLAANGIEIPFPQRDIHIKDFPLNNSISKEIV